MSVSSRQSSPSKSEAASTQAELQRMRDVCQKLALEKNAIFVKHQTALDDQNALKALHAQKMEMMLASLNNLLKSTGNVKVERVEDLILQEKALTEAILLKQGTLASIRRSGESSGERSLPGSPKGTVDHHPLSDEEDSSFTAGPQRPAFTTLTADDDLLPLCPSQPFMPSLSTPEDEPSISSHIIPVHAYVSAPDVQPTYQEILAEIKGRKKSGSRPPMDPTRQGAGPQRMKQRRNRIKRRTATPVAAIDKQDNLAMADSGEGPSSSSTEGSRKPSTSAPMELPDIQPFALRNVPPTTTANPDALQKDPWYKKGWFRRRTASDPPTSQAKIAENSELHFNRYYRIGELNGTKVMMRIRPTFASNRMDFGFKIKIIDEESSAPSDSAQQRA